MAKILLVLIQSGSQLERFKVLIYSDFSQDFMFVLIQSGFQLTHLKDKTSGLQGRLLFLFWFRAVFSKRAY